jgi:hypothetical protein
MVFFGNLAKCEIDFVGRPAAERHVWPILLVPIKDRGQLSAKRFPAKRDPRQLLERLFRREN